MKRNITKIPNEDRSVFHITLHVELIMCLKRKEWWGGSGICAGFHGRLLDLHSNVQVNHRSRALVLTAPSLDPICVPFIHALHRCLIYRHGSQVARLQSICRPRFTIKKKKAEIWLCFSKQSTFKHFLMGQDITKDKTFHCKMRYKKFLAKGVFPFYTQFLSCMCLSH